MAELPVEGFAPPSVDWRLNLPRDHGVHPASRTESWHVATHLRTEEGEDLGVQFSFLRLGIAPGDVPPSRSAWDIRGLNIGHVTFVDAASPRATGEERFGRAIDGLDGYDKAARELRFDNWTLGFGDDGEGGTMTLRATIADRGAVELVMRPDRPAQAAEPEGTAAPFVGYSLTRLSVVGTIDRGQGAQPVTGTAWFDHLWGDLPVPGGGPVAWDRVQLQLEDGTDISVIRSRRTDGRGTPTLSGIITDPGDGTSTMDEERLSMTSTRHWQDPTTKAAYPVAWRLAGPDMALSIEPVIDPQTHDFAQPLWSGLVRVEGVRSGADVSGVGTLQLTGYDRP